MCQKRSWRKGKEGGLAIPHSTLREESGIGRGRRRQLEGAERNRHPGGDYFAPLERTF